MSYPEPIDVIRRISAQRMMGVKDIVGDGQFPHIVKVRHEAIAACLAECPHRTPAQIGAAFNRHRTTVLYIKHGYRKLRAVNERNARIRQQEGRHVPTLPPRPPQSVSAPTAANHPRPIRSGEAAAP